jgi:hypothetical protein
MSMKQCSLGVLTAILFSSYSIAGTWKTLDKPGATSTAIYGIQGNNLVGSYDGHGFLYDGINWTILDISGASWKDNLKFCFF